MKSIQTIFSLIVSVLLTCGCGRELPFDDPQKGNGKESICISLKTSNEGETKAGTAKDGDVMNNIYIWIADGSDNIVYSGSYADGNSEGCSFELAGDGKTATAMFTNVERGEYTLYVIANLPASLSELTSKTTADNDFKNAVLPDLFANEPPFTEPPFTDTDGMPLSMRQSIHVGPGMNIVEAQLVRVCGRIRVTVRNMTTDKNIFIQSFQLTDKNPSKGYIFHKDDHGTPAGITFGAFDSYKLTGTQTTRYIAPGGEDTYIDQYLYETGLTGMGELGFEIVGGIYEDDVTEANLKEVVVSTTYSEGSIITTGHDTETQYLIVNGGGLYYLYEDGTTPKLKYMSDANKSGLISSGKNDGVNINKYLWTFTSTGNTSGLRNVSDGRYIAIDKNGVTLSADSKTFNVDVNATSGFRFSSGGYYMYSNNGTLSVRNNNTSESNRYWKLIPVTETKVTEKQLDGALKNFSKTNDSITYIDQYGLPVTLEHICRNDDVNVVINVFYSPESGVLYFRVEDWTDVSNNTTFD